MGGEGDMPGMYSPSRAPGEFWNVGGEPAMAIPPLPGEAWLPKKGSDFVHSVVYCAAVLVAPIAENSGEVVAL